jgi:cytidylate kinase
MIITVDGPAGSGKSTVARTVSARLGLPCLNSGSIYRTVTLLVLEKGIDFASRESVAEVIRGLDLRFSEDGGRVFVGERDVTSRLRDPDVTPQVYRVANDAFFRRLLVDLQRRSAGPRGVVAEGRDMGTVIFPEADFKFYLHASAEERARRHLLDLRARGHESDFERVLEETRKRDRHDSEREAAPLRVPEGAVVLDTEGLGADQVAAELLARIDAGSRAGGGAAERAGGGAAGRAGGNARKGERL